MSRRRHRQDLLPLPSSYKDNQSAQLSEIPRGLLSTVARVSANLSQVYTQQQHQSHQYFP